MKAATSSPIPRRKADRYLWYWKPPFNEPKSQHYFNREPWWKKHPEDIPHDAALYELLRRHPLVGELRLQMHDIGHGQQRSHHSVSELVVLKGPVSTTVELENNSLFH